MDALSIRDSNCRIIKPSDLFVSKEHGTAVISIGQKFVVPVPILKDGEPLVYPPEHPDAGEQILDYEGRSIGRTGIVFFNYKDQSIQAAPGDGNAVIIFNEVTEDQAIKLDIKIKKYSTDSSNLTLEQLKEIIEFAHKQLNLSDMYNSTITFIREKMSPVKRHFENEDPVYGLKKRNDQDVTQAVYIPGSFIFEGPAASAQRFQDGGVIIKQDGKMRGVQPDIFLRTYLLADGTEIKSVEKLVTFDKI